MKRLLICAAVLCGVLCSCSAAKAEMPEVVPPSPPALSYDKSEDGINPYVIGTIERYAEESRKFRHIEFPKEEVGEIPSPAYDAAELEILALIVYQEAGADFCSDETRLRVACVFLNRVESEQFPDGFAEVAMQKGQYGELYWTGIKWPARASAPGGQHAVERAYAIAKRVLEGERVLPSDVIFQSEFVMGEIVAHSDGMYFCR